MSQLLRRKAGRTSGSGSPSRAPAPPPVSANGRSRRAATKAADRLHAGGGAGTREDGRARGHSARSASRPPGPSPHLAARRRVGSGCGTPAAERRHGKQAASNGTRSNGLPTATRTTPAPAARCPGNGFLPSSSRLLLCLPPARRRRRWRRRRRRPGLPEGNQRGGAGRAGPGRRGAGMCGAAAVGTSRGSARSADLCCALPSGVRGRGLRERHPGCGQFCPPVMLV